MRIGLTFEDFSELRQMVATFPMSTETAARHLHLRGYDCKPAMVEFLATNGVVTLRRPDVWTREDVDVAADYFEQTEIFTPYAAMCQTLKCRYADFLRPLREASRHASEKYGQHVPAEDQYFVMHRIPPRCIADGGCSPAIISFSLCEDVLERLERGEEV